MNIIKSLLLFIMLLLSDGICADEEVMRRIMVGLKLFPAVVAADHRLTEKTDDKGFLRLYLLHHDDPTLASKLAERLRQIQHIKNLPIHVESLSFEDFIAGKSLGDSAAFFVQPPNSKLNKILERAANSSVLLFSPFKGDVEKGVHSGFIVSDRIFPYVNLTSMQESRIKMKAFFLRVSKKHD